MSSSAPTHGTITNSATGLPTGLSLNSGDGLISGTIGATDDTTGTYNVTVTATDGTNLATQSFVWTVSPPAAITISDQGSQSNLDSDVVDVPITASDPFGSAVKFSAAGLPAGLTINPSNGIISGTISSSADASSPYSVTISADDAAGNTASDTFQWTVAALSFTAPGSQLNVLDMPLTLDLQADSPAGSTLAYSNTGLPTGLALDSATGVISGTPETAGNYQVTITVSDGSHEASGTFTWQIASVGIVAPSDQTSTEGDVVSLQLAGIASGAVTYTAAGLPAGLTLNSQTGVISGTISAGDAAEGLYVVDVAAISGLNAGSQTFLWIVNPKVSVTALDDQTSKEGQVVSLQVTASETGATLTYSADGLPAGLAINSSTGLISGTLSTGAALAGPDYFVTVTVTDGTYSNTVFLVWTVNPAVQPAAPSLQNPGGQTSYAGQSVSVMVNASDAAGYGFDLFAENLPDGLFLDPFTGTISGTVADYAISTTPYEVSVTAVDIFGDETTKDFLWTVVPTTVTVQVNALSATLGTPTGPINVASFTTPDQGAMPEDFIALINWGDGKTSYGDVEGSDGSFTVVADHAFAATGLLPVSVDVTNVFGATAEADASGIATVADAAITMTGGFQLGALAGQSTSLTLAYFTDGSFRAEASDFSATIAWGDGSTSTATVTSAGAGLFEVTGLHSYSAIGLQTANITVTDAAGVSQSTTSTVEVGNLYAGVNGTLSLASFTDADSGVTAGSFTVSINWGDGNTTSGTVTQSGSQFTITGSHTFAVDSIDNTGGVYQVQVTITGDSKTLSTTVPVEVTRPASLLVVANVPAKTGTVVTSQVMALFIEPDATDGTTEFDASINWGDGSSGAGTVQEIASGLFQVIGSHTYTTSPTAGLNVSISQAWEAQEAAVEKNGNMQEDRLLPKRKLSPEDAKRLEALMKQMDAIKEEDAFKMMSTPGHARGFFWELDQEFFGKDLGDRLGKAKTKEEKEAIQARIDDMATIGTVIRLGLNYDLQVAKEGAKGADAKVAGELFEAELGKEKVRAAIGRISKAQIDKIEEHYPGIGGTKFSIKQAKALVAFENATIMFNNFELIKMPFSEAIAEIRKYTTKEEFAGPIITVRGGPDRSGAHARWYQFAKIVMIINRTEEEGKKYISDEEAAFWARVRPTLLLGTLITANILHPKFKDEKKTQDIKKQFPVNKLQNDFVGFRFDKEGRLRPEFIDALQTQVGRGLFNDMIYREALLHLIFTDLTNSQGIFN